jgi:protein-L-isoaspartate(D-aspartate) O-methyltransferase
MVTSSCLYYRFVVFPVLFILNFPAMEAQADFPEMRADMVENQIRRRGVSDPAVLAAMLKVGRHRFVPHDQMHLAYNDTPLPIGYGQTISQPYIVAYMTEILELEPTSRILEIGTGSGYQAAILAEICDSVFTIEVVPQLGDRADDILKSLGYRNVVVSIGDGYKGWPAKAPFDAILVTCAPSHVPKALREQLAEGGKMIIPVGEKYVQELVLLEKKNGKLRQKAVLPVLFVPMVDDGGKSY